MRILAVDLGDVRTGLAAGEDLTGTVQPLEVIVERDPERRFEKIVSAAEAFGPHPLLDSPVVSSTTITLSADKELVVVDATAQVSHPKS